jgi:hypothetical protein
MWFFININSRCESKFNKYCNFKVLVSINSISDFCNNITRKHQVFINDKFRDTPKTLVILLPTFMIKENVKYPLEVK